MLSRLGPQDGPKLEPKPKKTAGMTEEEFETLMAEFEIRKAEHDDAVREHSEKRLALYPIKNSVLQGKAGR